MKLWFRKSAISKNKFWAGFCPQPISWEGRVVWAVYLIILLGIFYFFPIWQRPYPPIFALYTLGILLINALIFATIYFVTREKV